MAIHEKLLSICTRIAEMVCPDHDEDTPDPACDTCIVLADARAVLKEINP